MVFIQLRFKHANLDTLLDYIGCQYRTMSELRGPRVYVCRKEGNVLFNDTLNTFYLRLYGIRHMIKNHSDSHIGYSFRLAARVLLYASSHRQDNTYHSLCYTSHGALAGTRNSSMGPILKMMKMAVMIIIIVATAVVIKMKKMTHRI